LGEEPEQRKRGYAHRWLLLLPFIWQIGLVPFANDVQVRVVGLPFPMVWQMAGVLVATLCIALVFRIDRRIEGDDDGIPSESAEERP
jgi:hypothetical protein